MFGIPGSGQTRDVGDLSAKVLSLESRLISGKNTDLWWFNMV